MLGRDQFKGCSGLLLVDAGFQATPPCRELVEADFTLDPEGLDGLPTRGLRLHDPASMRSGICFRHGHCSSASDMAAARPPGYETRDTPDPLG